MVAKTPLICSDVEKAFEELLSWTKHPKLNISGGEPFIWKDIIDLLRFTIEKGALTGVVTNGYAMTPYSGKATVMWQNLALQMS